MGAFKPYKLQGISTAAFLITCKMGNILHEYFYCMIPLNERHFDQLLEMIE